MLKVRSNLLYSVSIAIVVLILFFVPFNHKELFSIYKWDLLPIRFVSATTIILGSFLAMKKFKNLDTFFVIFFELSLISFASIAVSINQLKSIQFSFFTLFLPFIYLILKNILIINPKFFTLFHKLFFIFSFISCIVVYVQLYYFINYSALFGAVWPVPNNLPRFGGLFWDVNHFALYIVLGLWSLLISFMSLSQLKNKIIFGALGLIMIFPLYLTSSRSSLLGMFAGIVFFLSFFSFKNKVVRRYFTYTGSAILSLFPVILFLFLTIFGNIIRDAFFYRIHSFFTHFILLKIGFNLFLEHPLLGVGANDFSSSLKGSPFFSEFSLLDPGALNYAVPIHSVWMSYLAETGIFAFLLFLTMSIFIFYLGIKNYLKTKNVNILILLSAFVSMLVAGIFYSYNLEFFYLYLGFIAAYIFLQYEFKFSVFTQFLKSVILNNKLLYTIIILAVSGFIFSFLDKNPSFSEIAVFNTAKEYSAILFPITIIDFYYKYLNLLQNVFGFFPYVGRLVSVILLFSSFFVFYKIGTKYTSSKIFVLYVSASIILLSMFYNSFFILPTSLYIYLISLVVYLITFMLPKFKVRIRSIINRLSILSVIISVILCFSTLITHPSYMDTVSTVSKTLAQKFSINDYSFIVDDPSFIPAVSFYKQNTNNIFVTNASNITTEDYFVITKQNLQNLKPIVTSKDINVYAIKNIK